MDKTHPVKEIAAVYMGGNVLVRMLDSFFVLRPTLMFPLWTMVLAGCGLSYGGQLTAGRWGLLVIGLSGIFGLVYLINQVTDKETDRRNQKLYLISEGALSHKHMYIEAGILAVGSPLALMIGGFEYIIFWALGMIVFAGFFYSYKPVALQRSPVGGLISGLVGGWLLIHVGGLLLGESVGFVRELPYLLAFTSSSILTGLLDVEGDQATGKRTFVVVYGEKKAIVTALVGIIIAAFLSALTFDWVILIPSVLTCLILMASLLRGSSKLAVTANKLAIFGLSVCVGIHYPVYLLVIVIYFVLARWYYSRRFKLQYPSFQGG